MESFENWQTTTLEEWSYEFPLGGWTGADAALSLVKMMLANEDIDFNSKSLVSTDDAHTGAKAAKIVTLDTHGQARIMPGFFPAIPKVTSGSLFLGSFEIDALNTLHSTRFGILYSNKPLVVKGYYKYTPGTDYYSCDNVADSHIAVLDATKKDECSISAVLYEVNSYDIPDDPYAESDDV